MPHISIPTSSMCEFLNFTPVNPLISKVQIKVCYVGDEPNRNGSIITKAVATEMAKSLPGCPIVGFFNKDTGDFEEHSRKITITNNSFEMEDMTKPYGFVSMDAKVWFQKFQDDGVEHEYLCTEGYIWSETYPEAKRIIEHGNNQSMELNENIKGSWTADDNGFPEFFIINEALIEKLCVLGENVEPCFEGANISNHFTFSLGEDFKQKMFSMMNELKEALNKGGNVPMEDNKNKSVEETEFKKKPEEEEEDKKKGGSENEPEEKDEGKKGKENKPDPEEKKKDEEKSDEKKPEDDDEDEKKKKKKFSLEEIPEYVELSKNFAALQKDFKALSDEVETLRTFKASAERAAKEDMIKSFYMLSDAEKKDCLDNIDTYSLDDIEAKLSIICVRNKVSFNLDEDTDDKSNKNDPTVYNLDNNDDGDSAPAWIKAVRNTAKEMN